MMLFQGESRVVEYKLSYSKTLLKTVSAYANYHDGYIVLGVDDSGKVVGLDDADEIKLSLENAINDALRPRPFYEMWTEMQDGKALVVLKVYKGDSTPYVIGNRAYKRNDTSTVQVDRASYEELILLGKNLSYEKLASDNQTLRFKLLGDKLEEFLGIDRFSEDLLVTLGLKFRGQYNNAAALLSDVNPLKSSVVQLVAYMDSGVMHIRDRQTLNHLSVLKQYDHCMDFYRKHINVSERIDGPYRKTIEEIPLVAYREAVANAILHRDYTRKVDMRVEVFSDRVEIMSPGSLPVGITEQEYYEGKVSVPRNQLLADVFLRLGIIEKLATGIRRIKEYYRAYDVTPEFRVGENSILVILPKVIAEEKVKERGATYLDSLNDHELLIYRLLQKNGEMKRMDIEDALGLRKSQTVELIRHMRERQLIAQIGNGRTTRYTLRK